MLLLLLQLSLLQKLVPLLLHFASHHYHHTHQLPFLSVAILTSCYLQQLPLSPVPILPVAILASRYSSHWLFSPISISAFAIIARCHSPFPLVRSFATCHSCQFLQVTIISNHHSCQTSFLPFLLLPLLWLLLLLLLLLCAAAIITAFITTKTTTTARATTTAGCC